MAALALRIHTDMLSNLYNGFDRCIRNKGLELAAAQLVYAMHCLHRILQLQKGLIRTQQFQCSDLASQASLIRKAHLGSLPAHAL